MNSTALQKIFSALAFAADKHRGQKRKDTLGSPYINHPIEVAERLVHFGVEDPNVLQAAVLHDTVEDTEATEEDILVMFGNKVKSIVMELTDDKSLSKKERKQRLIEKSEKFSLEAKLVKLADHTCNLHDIAVSTPRDWSDERCLEYALWSAQVIKNCRAVNEGLEKEYDRVHDLVLKKFSGINLHLTED